VSAPGPDTCVACLTPAGQSALATLGLQGPSAWEVVRQLFRLCNGTTLPASPETGRFWLGRLGADVANEVVLAVKRTGPVPWLEVHCHGGREVVRFLLELFTAHGLRECTWQEFVGRTENGELSRVVAVALTEARTARTASILLDQYQGAFAVAIGSVRAALERGDEASAATTLAELAQRAALGRHLTNPWRVAVAGAPNVGKSSLVNALAGYQRSVVSAAPGTTRDVVTTGIAVDGWPVELADTAGLRASAEGLEEQGIGRARETFASSDLCLWLLDGSAEPVWPGEEMGTVRFVINKTDLPATWDWSRAGKAVRVSARMGTGLDSLCAALSRWLVPEAPPAGAAVPFTEGLADWVEDAQRNPREGSNSPADVANLLNGPHEREHK
jgi:tRNA modification GTPase